MKNILPLGKERKDSINDVQLKLFFYEQLRQNNAERNMLSLQRRNTHSCVIVLVRLRLSANRGKCAFCERNYLRRSFHFPAYELKGKKKKKKFIFSEFL